MTTQKAIERVFPADLFAAPPVVGDCFASQSGLSVLVVGRVRKVVGDRGGPSYRLIGTRAKLADMGSAVVLPWPKRVEKPSKAALPTFGPPPPPPKRVTLAQAQVAARRRVVALLRDDRDSNRVVHKVRVDNKTAVVSEWKDNEDLNPNRRTVRVIHGYRSRDSVTTLVDSGTINRGHANAARRFRKEYELGYIGLRPSRDLSAAPSGFASGTGPSESRMRALEVWGATAKALMPHMLEVMIAIVIADETIVSYAERKHLNRSLVSGYALASFDTLKFLYSERDRENEKERRVETIGPGLGPDPH